MPAQSYEGALSRTSDLEYVGAKDYLYRQQDFFTFNTIEGASFYAAPKGYLNRLTNIKGQVIVNNNRKEADREYAGANNYKLYKERVHQHVKTFFGEKEAWIPSGNLGGEFVNGEEKEFKERSLLDRIGHFVDDSLKITKLPDTLDTGVLVKGEAYKAYRQVLNDVYNHDLKERYSIGAGMSVVRGDVATKLIATTLEQAKKGDVVYFSRAFTPHKSVDRALVIAARAGVDVNVITNSPTEKNAADFKFQQELKAAGVKITYSKKKFAHLKDFSITGSIDRSVTGSTNYTNANYKNSSADVSLIVDGKNEFSTAVKANLKLIFDTFSRPKDLDNSFYSQGEFGFLYKTAYGTVDSRSTGTIVPGEGETGYIKSTKLSEGYFDRHIGRALPKYSGFTSTYEAITGIRAHSLVRDMDAAVGTPSVGHQINRALGIKLYTDGLGAVGSAVALGGRLADFLTGHYVYKRDLEKHKGVKGSLRKFEALLDREWQKSTEYEGGPIEVSANAMLSAVKSLVVSTVGYGAVLSVQYGLADFLDEGAKKAVEPGIQKTGFQKIMAYAYLSFEGLEVNELAQDLMRRGVYADPTQATRAAMATTGIQPSQMLGRNSRLPAIVNRMRLGSGAMMEYALPSLLQLVVPSAHLPSALRAGTELVAAISAPITMNEKGLHYLAHERSRKIGTAIERLTSHIPLELHLWVPSVREKLGANGMAPLDDTVHYPLGTLDGGARVSLASLMGDGIIKNTIAGFMQTSRRTAEALADPAGELAKLKSQYALTRKVVAFDRYAADAISSNQPNALLAAKKFMSLQQELSEQLKHYGTGAPITSRSAGNGVLSQGVFKRNLGRAGLAIAAVFVGDFLLDEFVLRTQGADLIQQMALTRATRNSEGSITQVELNGTVPLVVTALTAGIAGVTGGHLFPTIYGASQYSSGALRNLAASTSPELAALRTEVADYAGTRARFNFKAAAISATLGLIGLKVGFIAGAAILSTLFPVKGVKLDPESEIATAKLLKVLNRTKRRSYRQGASGLEEVNDDASVGSLVTRELIKAQIDRFSASDIRARNRSSGSSFYSVALQLTNTGFVQTAIVQRTDTLQQKTTYALGIQLFASAGMGLTPNLPFGLVTQRASKKQQLKLAELQDQALGERYDMSARNIKGFGLVQTALDMFGFLSFEPNSQIGNSLLGLGALGYVTAGFEKFAMPKTYGPQQFKPTELQLDMQAFRKVAKMGLELTTSFIRYTTALTDFLPRVMSSGFKAAFPEVLENTGSRGERVKFVKGVMSPLVKSRFAILGYALGVAMSDPYLGVEALDSTDAEVNAHPFTNPLNRLATAATMAGVVHFGATTLGLGEALMPSSMMSQVVPGASRYQQVLHSADSNPLQKSAARVGLVAGLVFASYLGANIVARTIGTLGGEDALAATYQRVGALRLLSGVAAADYRQGGAYARRNLIGDVIGDVISKIPFIGKTLADVTGLYKDDANLHAPILGTPFGISYRKDGSTKPFGQVGNITTDVSIAANTKFKLGFTRDELRMFTNLENANFDSSSRPDDLVVQVLRGGVPRAKKMKISDVSGYAVAALQQDGDNLARAFRLKQLRRNFIAAQRPSELEFDERRRAYSFGVVGIWTGSVKDKLPQGRVGVNLGLQITTTEYSSTGKAVNPGDYISFAEANENSAYKDRNVYAPAFLQGIKDMYTAFNPPSKKREKNALAAGILSFTTTVAGSIIAYNTFLSSLEIVGAVEVAKFGASANRLNTDRFSNAKEFYYRNRIDITLDYDAQGAPVAQMKSAGRREGVGFNHRVALEPLGLDDVRQVRSTYIQSLQKLQEYFSINPAGLSTYTGGVQTNVYDLLLRGDTDTGLNALRTKFIEKLTDPTVGGILKGGVGTSDYYKAILNGASGTTAVSFASDIVAPAQMYEPLGTYAAQLNQRVHLDVWQRRELLAAAKTQIEMAAVERHVLSLTTNSVDRAAIEAFEVAQVAPPPEMSAGLSGTFKRAASGAGILMAGYLAFGRDAYALSESAVFLTSSNPKLRKYAAYQAVTTTANLALGLTLQKFVSSMFGTKQFGLLSLGLAFGVSLGLNFAAGKIKETQYGTGITKAERGVTNFLTGILENGGELISQMGGSILSDFLGSVIFRPLGNKIGTTYNEQSRMGLVNATLSQMFLPDSVFKTNNYLPKSVTYGGKSMRIPFVMSTEYNTDLAAYYRELNSRELMGTMSIGLNPKYTANFTLGRPDQKLDYAQAVLNEKFFDLTKQRTALSPLSNFTIGSNYRMSEGLIMQIGMRAAQSDFARYGRVFRRAVQPNHDYTGQAISGLSLGNEASRIATQAQSGFSRPIADAYTSVDRVLFDPFRRIGRGVARLAAMATNRVAYAAEGAVAPVVNIVSSVGSRIGNFFGGVSTVGSLAMGAAVAASQQGIVDRTIAFEQKLEALSGKITQKYSGPIARVGLEFLRGTSTVAFAGGSMLLKGLDMLPTFNATVEIPTLPVPQFGFYSMANLVNQEQITELGYKVKGGLNFLNGNLPFFLDAFQVVPSTYALKGATESRLTRMERMRLYEQQASATGGVVFGLLAAAARANLLTSILVSGLGAYGAGQLGRKNASNDYDNNSTSGRDLQVGLGIASVLASGASSLISYHRRVEIYNNYTEVFTNEHDSKRARVVYDRKFTNRVARVDADIARTVALPDSKYKTQKLQQLYQQQLVLKFEHNHEQAHLKAFDVPSQEFAADSPAAMLGLQRGAPAFTANVESGLRRLAETSAQDRLYQAPHIDEGTYQQIVELEYQAHAKSYMTSLHEAEVAGNPMRATPEAVLNHYVNRMDRQMRRGRSVTRVPGILVPGETALPIDRLYNPTASGAGAGTHSAPARSALFNNVTTSVHYEKFAAITTTGFSRGARLVAALQTIFGLPAALYETYAQKEQLRLLQSDLGTTNSLALDTELRARGGNNLRYLYAGSITGALTAVFNNPVGLVAGALYGGLASLGASIPFTDIPMVPTFARTEVADMYARYQHGRIRSGNYAYEPWMPTAGPLNSLKHHSFDAADRQLAHAVAGKAMGQGAKMAMDTVGYFKARPIQRLGLVAAALTFAGVKIFGLRDTSLAMFDAIGLATIYGIYYGTKAVIANLPAVIAGIKSYLTEGLELTSTANNEFRLGIKPGAKTTFGSQSVVRLQGAVLTVGKFFGRVKDTLRNFTGAYRVGNIPIEYGSFTGLPTKYLSSDVLFKDRLTKVERGFVMVASAPKRLFTYGHRAARTVAMLGKSIAHAIEDFGISGKIPIRAVVQPGAKASLMTKVINWFDNIAVNFLERAPRQASVVAGTPVTPGTLSRLVKLGAAANWLANMASRAVVPVLKGAAILLTLGTIFHSHGYSGLGVAAIAGGATYAAYKGLKLLTIGKSISHQILKEGVFGTALNGLLIANDSMSIIGAAIKFGRSDSRRLSRKEYQQFYTESASGTTGLISTLEIFPRLGFLRGLVTSSILSLGMNYLAEQKANRRQEESAAGLSTPTYVLAFTDLINPAIKQVQASKEIGTLYDATMKTRLGQRISGAFGRTRVGKLWQGTVVRGAEAVSAAVKARAVRAFGTDFLEGAAGLAASAAKVARGVGTFFKGLGIAIDVGTAGYGVSKIMQAKSDAQRKQGYQMAGRGVGALVGFIGAGIVGSFAEALPGPGTFLHAAFTATGGLVGGEIGDYLGGALGNLHNSMSKQKPISFNLEPLGAATFNYVFGYGANASEVPTTMHDTALSLTGKVKADPGYKSPLEMISATANMAINSIGTGWRNFKIGIGNLNKEAKLKWGRFSNAIGGSHFIIGYKPPVAAAATSSMSEGSAGISTLGGSVFTGTSPTISAVVELAKLLPGTHREKIIRAIKGGSVYEGRAEQTIEFMNDVRTAAVVRGKSIKFDANFKAFGDTIAMLEVHNSTNISSYATPGTSATSPRGRYQIGIGSGDTDDLRNVIKGGINSSSPDQQDRALVGRMFYARLPGQKDPGGTAFMNFINNGYQKADFVKALQQAGHEWEVVRASGTTYYGGAEKGKTYVDRNYGSRDAGYHLMYQMFMARKKLYEEGGAKKLPDPATPNILPAQADAILKPPTPKKAAAKIKASASATHKVATIKYGTPQNTVPVVAGRQLNQPTREVAINLSTEDGQLKARAVMQDGDTTYFSQANNPASMRRVNGRRLSIA